MFRHGGLPLDDEEGSAEPKQLAKLTRVCPPSDSKADCSIQVSLLKAVTACTNLGSSSIASDVATLCVHNHNR